MNNKYKVIEKLGRAGSAKNRDKQKQIWDNKYGEKNWTTGYMYKDIVYDRNESLEKFFYASYIEYMSKNRNLVNNLIKEAKELFNPHAVFTTGVDLQVPAVLKGLEVLKLSLQGTKKIAIASFQPKNWDSKTFDIIKEYELDYSCDKGICKIKYPKLSYDFSPYNVPFFMDKAVCIEDFWQNYKYLLLINN